MSRRGCATATIRGAGEEREPNTGIQVVRRAIISAQTDWTYDRHTLKVRQKKRIMLVMEKDGDSDGTGAKTVDFWDPVQSLGATAAETSVNSIARGRRAPLISKPTN